MNIVLDWNGIPYSSDLSKGTDLALLLNPYGPNVSCYWASPPYSETIRMGDFVGSVAAGGSVNYEKITLTPHGNGTHTESLGHITAKREAIGTALGQFHWIAELVSVEVEAQGNDWIIPLARLQHAIQFPKAQALIIRSLPNLEKKKTNDYSGTNPPFLAPEVGEWLRTKEYMHLLVDLPSVDKEEDGGKLSVHRGFWDIPNKPRKDCTITELIWVPPHTADGLYLLNLQVPAWNTDAAPSRPVIYPMVKNQPY